MAEKLGTSMITNVLYVSHDRGKTWKPTFEANDGREANGDPVCGFTPDGGAYAVSLAKKPTRATVPPPSVDYRTAWQTQVYRSADGGLMWELEPARFEFLDHEAGIVDRTGGRFHGRMYVVGQTDIATLDDKRLRALKLYRSLDGGRSFLGPVMRSMAVRTFILVGPSVVVSDGTLIMPVSAGEPTRLAAFRSTDGGQTLEPEIKVASMTTASAAVSAAVDRSAAFKDRVYVAWSDTLNRRCRVLLSFSRDKGKTWSPPRVVDDSWPRPDNGRGPDMSLPRVVVNHDGVVGVSWYDTRDHADNRGWDLRFAASLDGGETFSPSIRVSSQSNTFTSKDVWPVNGGLFGSNVNAGSRDGVTVGFSMQLFADPGDYNGMAVGADGTFHPFWVDNRTGLSHIWTAPVTVAGIAAPHGSSELAKMEDVSEKVSITNSEVMFDRSTGKLTSVLRLKNNSDETLRGPVKLRLIALESELGSLSVRGADNGGHGVGAVWDVTALLGDSALAPGEESQGLKLTLTLPNAQAFDSTGGVRSQVAVTRFRVLAGNAGK